MDADDGSDCLTPTPPMSRKISPMSFPRSDAHDRPSQARPGKRQSIGRRSITNCTDAECEYLEKWNALRVADEDGSSEEDEHTMVMDGRKTTRFNSTEGVSSIHQARKLAQRVTTSRYFDTAMGGVIVANSMIIGVEQSYRLSNKDPYILNALEYVFLSIYLLELFIRFFAGGITIVKDRWTQFDICIVMISVATVFSDIVIGADMSSDFGPVVIIRLARLARLARTVRVVILFRELWMLVHGLIASSSMMVYTLALLSLIIYVFALLGVEVITMKYMNDPDVDPGIHDIIQEYFPSLPVTMLTLTQFVTFDSISQIYRPLIILDPWLMPYFISLILVVGIVLMNLITAVLVNGALEQAQQNKEAETLMKEKQKKILMKRLRHMFVRLDTDETGYVDISEVLLASADDLAFFLEYSKSVDPVSVFHHLDIDGSGELDIDEFCEGLYQALLSQTPIEQILSHKRVEVILTHTNKNMEMLDGIGETLSKLMPDSELTRNRTNRKLGDSPTSSRTNSKRQFSRPISRQVSPTSHSSKMSLEVPSEELLKLREELNKNGMPQQESAAATSTLDKPPGCILPSAVKSSSSMQPGITLSGRLRGPPQTTQTEASPSEWDVAPANNTERTLKILPSLDSERYGSGDSHPGQEWSLGNAPSSLSVKSDELLAKITDGFGRPINGVHSETNGLSSESPWKE